jgi:hypothetical protein
MTYSHSVLAPLALLASALAVRSALSQQQRPRGTVAVDSCLPASEFQLRGVALTSLSSMGLETLGPPLRVKTGSGEDDGGRYEVRTFHYRDLAFDDVRGFVDRLETHSPQVATPSGLRVGLKFDAAQRLLRDQGVRITALADTILITTCPTPDTSQVAGPEGDMAVVLDKTRHVSAIVMRAARP